MNKEFNILKLIAEDKHLITYRPELNQITGSVLATILLQQIMFRWYSNKQKNFFKFKEPCGHEHYKAGDSWCEELGFTKYEFDTALSKISTKITKGTKLADLNKQMQEKPTLNHAIYYWTDKNRKTWYMLNSDLLYKLIKPLYIVNGQNQFSKSGNTYLYNSENITENTTKIKEEKHENEHSDTENLSSEIINQSVFENSNDDKEKNTDRQFMIDLFCKDYEKLYEEKLKITGKEIGCITKLLKEDKEIFNRKYQILLEECQKENNKFYTLTPSILLSCWNRLVKTGKEEVEWWETLIKYPEKQ